MRLAMPGEVALEIDTIFDASYGRVLEHEVGGQGFFETFYARFVAASPEVAEKFRHTDMVRQRAMLKKSFYHLLAFYASSHADYYLNKVAISHNRRHLDIRPGLYDLWLDAMVESVRRHDPHCCPEVELAWRLVMSPGIVYMKFHYDRDVPVAHGALREGPHQDPPQEAI